MKTVFLFSFILIIIMSSTYSQERTVIKDEEKKSGKRERTEMLLNSKEFTFKARRAIPSRGASIDLTTNPNYVKFQPEFIESYMPFFGRAYSGVGYGKDTGLHFKGQPDVFTVEKKKRNYHVSVTVKGEVDNFRLYLTVSPGGNASLTISSNNRESISYMGEVTETEN